MSKLFYMHQVCEATLLRLSERKKAAERVDLKSSKKFIKYGHNIQFFVLLLDLYKLYLLFYKIRLLYYG